MGGICTLDEAKFEVLLDSVGIEAAEDVLDEHSSSASELDQPERLLDLVGVRTQRANCFCLQEDSEPSRHHFPKQRRYLRSCGEIALLREDIVLSIVSVLLISECLFPIVRNAHLSSLFDLLDHEIPQFVRLVQQFLQLKLAELMIFLEHGQAEGPSECECYFEHL